MTNERTNAELIQAIREEDKGLGEHAMLSARIIHNTVTVMQAANLEWRIGKGSDVAMAWIENLLIDTDNIPEEEYEGAGDLKNAHDPDLYFRDNHLSGELSPYQSRMAPLIDELERRIELLQKSLDEANATLKAAREQEPVAFWWIGLDGEPYGGPHRGTPSDAAIYNARIAGCDPQLLFAVPIPAPAQPETSPEVTNLQRKCEEAREELEKTRERLTERLKSIESPFEVVNPTCLACGDGTTSLCDHEDCPSGRFRGYDPMNRLIASDPKMKNPNCPREPIAKCVDGYCINEAAGRERCSSESDFIAEAMAAPSPALKAMTVAEAQELCAVSCAIGSYPQVLSSEVTRLQDQVEAARKMTLQIINVHVVADDIPGPSEKARRYYNRLAERFGVDRLEGSHENG